MRSFMIGMLALSGVGLMTWSIAAAAGPAQADFDTCNREAHAQAASPSAAPATGGDSAKPGTPVSPSATPTTETPSTPSPPPASGVGPDAKPGTPVSPSAAPATSASDDVVRGMAAAGHTDPAFRSAYMGCMKRRGFE